MTTRLDTAWPELVLPPDATIAVELDDPLAIVTKLNVYGFTPAREEPPTFDVLPALLSYGAEQ